MISSAILCDRSECPAIAKTIIIVHAVINNEPVDADFYYCSHHVNELIDTAAIEHLDFDIYDLAVKQDS